MNTQSKILIAAIVGIVVGAGGAMTFSKGDIERTSKDSDAEHMMQGGQMMHGSGMGMQDEMTGMNAMLEGKTGDAFDQAFLSGMIMHHEGAVQMAESALKDAKHQEIKDLANAIISAQNKEIGQMKAWQKTWYPNDGVSAN